MTRAILRAKDPTDHLTSCEIEESRYNTLRSLANEENLSIQLADAASCLDTFDDSSIDLIVSTLPLGSMPPVQAREIVETAARALSSDGIYMQYQYFATNK
jgi:phospholipid N-methyltransferase